MRASFRSALLIPVALAASLGAAACTRQIGGNVYEGRAAGEAVRTQLGFIESARVVQIQENDRLEQNTAGIVIGGATGGLIANQIGHGWGRILATGAGALAGATVGALAEQEMKRQPAMEYVFRSETGELYTVVQGMQPRLAPGQRVYLQQSQRGRARLVPAG